MRTLTYAMPSPVSGGKKCKPSSYRVLGYLAIKLSVLSNATLPSFRSLYSPNQDMIILWVVCICSGSNRIIPCVHVVLPVLSMFSTLLQGNLCKATKASGEVRSNSSWQGRYARNVQFLSCKKWYPVTRFPVTRFFQAIDHELGWLWIPATIRRNLLM